MEIRFPRVEGYRVELPDERLTASFNDDSKIVLTPAVVGPTRVKLSGIIGATAEINLEHLEEVRHSTLLFHLTHRLLYTKYRDPGEEPPLYLFGQLKRIVNQWLSGGFLECKGGTYPAQLMYQELADMACERIVAGITRAAPPGKPIKALLDAYNPTGSTAEVNFNTSKTTRYAPERSHLNWAILDSDWEGEFCRVADSHPSVRAWVKNHNLGFEVPYLSGSGTHRYRPDFIVLVDDGRGEGDLLRLVVEIKGYRGEDAKEKKSAIETYWIPGVNNLGTHGRWAFAEFTQVYEIETDFKAKVDEAFEQLIGSALARPAA